jgi:hypothetical protein
MTYIATDFFGPSDKNWYYGIFSFGFMPIYATESLIGSDRKSSMKYFGE